MNRIYKTRIFCLLSLVLAGFLWSCEFTLEEVYTNEANPNVSPSEIQVVNLNVNNDTVYIYGSRTINFVFKSTNQAIKATKVFFDNNEILSVTGSGGSFTLNSYNISNGIHNLTFKVYTGTNSGSIADQLDLEQFEHYKTWTVASFQDFYAQANPSIVNGLLKFSWTKCLSDEFKEFEVIRHGIFAEDIIIKTNKAEFVDSAYIGENRYYSIKAVFKDGTRLDWSSLSIVSTSYPQLYFYTDDQNQSMVKWKRSKYFNAIDSVVVYKEISYNTYEVVSSFHNPNDTVCIVPNLLFQTSVNLMVKMVSKKFAQIPTSTSHSQSLLLYNAQVGYRFTNDHIWKIHQAAANEVIFITNSDSIIRYSTALNAPVSKLYASNFGFSPMYFSPNGKYLTAFVNSHNSVLLVNTLNFQSNKTLTLSHLTGFYYYPYMPVSNNGKLLVSSNSDGVYLYDFINESTIAHYYNPANLYQNTTFKISSEGDYFLLQDDSLRLVKYANGSFTTVHADRFFTEYKYFEFHPTEKDKFIFWDGAELSIRSSDDFSVISSIPFTDKGILNIDYHSNRFLSYIQGHLYVRDFTTGDILYDIPLNYMVSDWYNVFYLTGNMILSSSGVAYFLN